VADDEQEDLYDYSSRVRRTIVEVLDDFKHLKIPINYIFDIFPPLRPREFSIASSVLVKLYILTADL
jgi:sulfite reductase alpha subunit-like flavoprotein